MVTKGVEGRGPEVGWQVGLAPWEGGQGAWADG